MQLFDCTLRDGANVVGKGFSAELTNLMLKGLTGNGIKYIEMGNALGVGLPNGGKSESSLSDAEYFACMAPYRDLATIGMFMGAYNADENVIAQCAENKVRFLRIGNNAGDAKDSEKAVKLVKKHCIDAYYAMMKGYLLSPEQLADEAKMLEDYGLDAVTIMDSAGTMSPSDVSKYVAALKKSVSIPVGFHGHNNLGFSAANALAAYEAGADLIDCGLMGMARSAGNLATEIALGVFGKMGVDVAGDLIGLLHFIDEKLIPAMKPWYECPVKPIDLIYGYAGAHSSFAKLFRDASEKYGVDLFRLIIETSRLNRKNPNEELVAKVAANI